jgi:hypothetical protein
MLFEVLYRPSDHLGVQILNEASQHLAEEQSRSGTSATNLVRADIDDDTAVNPSLPVYCLLIRLRLDTEEIPLAYGLLIQRCGAVSQSLGPYRRVGLAQVFLEDFGSVASEPTILVIT